VECYLCTRKQCKCKVYGKQRVDGNFTACYLEHLYDHGMVWAFEIQGAQMVSKFWYSWHSSDQLGYSPLRVFFSGSCQPFRLQGKWRPIFTPGAKGYSGSDYPAGIYNFHRAILQNRKHKNKPPNRLLLYGASSLLRIQKVMGCAGTKTKKAFRPSSPQTHDLLKKPTGFHQTT